ncbi:MAG: alpha/beta fold hydrolase [Rubrivivax sp.]|nr:alpha/beta fold hydrolase [Rubrivivax sp.]
MPRIVVAPLRRCWRPGLRVLGLCAALALGGCAWLDVQQRQAALRPSPGRPAGFEPGAAAGLARFRPGDERWTVQVPAARSDGSPSAAPRTEALALWWLPHPDPAAPTLLYLHGSFRNLYLNLPKIDALRDGGFAVLAVDYRGWGDSAAIVPSEATITADAAVAWAELQRRQPLPQRRWIFGHSMGGAVAVTLASGLHGGRDYAALALESTFTRLPDVAAAAGFWGRVAGGLTTLEFDALARIGRIDAPLLMLHGTADNTVPVALGRRLRDAAPPGVRWVEVPGGSHSRLHSEAPETYRRAFTELLQSLPAP